MALRRFCDTIGRNETEALSFLRHRDVLGSVDSVRCPKVNNGTTCGSVMYEGRRSQNSAGVRKAMWRCKRREYNGSFSVRANNEFFYYTKITGRTHARLEIHVILEIVYMHLYCTQTLDKGSFNIGVPTLTGGGATCTELLYTNRIL